MSTLGSLVCRRMVTGKSRDRKMGQGQNRDGANRGKTSLRLDNSGRRQRRTSSRGSLRKRDRTAEREAKAEAAEERRKVSLPE